MEFAVNVPTSVGKNESTHLIFADGISWDVQRKFGVALDELGFDALSVPDHLTTGEGATETLTTLAALATETDSIDLYPKTINNTLRHGPLLVKYATTIDNISDGRLKLGMGAGWHDEEAIAYGYEWPSGPDRLRAMEETIEIAKLLWTADEPVTYEGDYHSVKDCMCTPKPVQDPHPPIMVGGAGEEFTLRIAAKHADIWNYLGPLNYFERKLDVLADHCETYGRDYDEIKKSWFGRCVIRETEEEVERLLEKVPRFRPENWDKTGGGAPEFHLVGTPEQIASDIDDYEALGVDEIVVEFVDFPRTDGAEVFIDEIVSEFA